MKEQKPEFCLFEIEFHFFAFGDFFVEGESVVVKNKIDGFIDTAKVLAVGHLHAWQQQGQFCVSGVEGENSLSELIEIIAKFVLDDQFLINGESGFGESWVFDDGHVLFFFF